jgi:hypothetical protein
MVFPSTLIAGLGAEGSPAGKETPQKRKVETVSPGKVKGANHHSANPFFIIGSAGHTAVRTFHLPYYSNIKEHLA